MWQWTIKQTSYSENSNCEREKQKQELWAGIALLSDLPVPVEKSYSFKVQTLREDRSERVRLISGTKSVSWKSRRTGFLALLLAPVPTAQPSLSAFSAKPPRDKKAKPFLFYPWLLVFAHGCNSVCSVGFPSENQPWQMAVLDKSDQ